MNKDNIQRPKVGLGVIILKDNKVLLGKRKKSHGAGVWHFPGGHLEFNESWEDCARRETKEEVNLEIKNIRFASATNDIFVKEEKHYITIFVLSDYAGGDLKVMEPDKAEAWDWYEWDKMPKPYFLTIENLLKQGYSPFEK